MRIEQKEQFHLNDSRGGKLSVSSYQGFDEILTEEGYLSLDLTYGKKVMLSRDKLMEDFQHVDNSIFLSHNSSNYFDYFYKTWYNPEWDIYIDISNSNSLNRYDDFEDENELDSKAVSFRMNSIYYKPDDSKSLNTYLNSVIVSNPPTGNTIDIVIQTSHGYKFEEYPIKSVDIDIDKMYNDDFAKVNSHVIDKLNNAGKGIVLFYGPPGTGKTSYIKWLTTQVQTKFVFIPINMISNISSPSFIGDLIKNKGSILVIEDCENFIQDRSISQDSIVSPLLQITDGILSDLLDIKIICTFNTDLTKIDPALMREGRMIAEYEFNKLSADKVDVLTDGKYNVDMSLAKIYNDLTYVENKKVEKTIGF